MMGIAAPQGGWTGTATGGRGPGLRASLPAVALLLGASLLLGLLQALPRAGLPVVLVFAPGTGEDRALLGVLAEPGWDPVALRRAGPFTLAVAAPAIPSASAAALARRAGALAALHLPWGRPCAALP